MMLRKGIKDVIVGCRSAQNPKEFLAICLAEAKSEVKETDFEAKYDAILKLLYFYYERIDVTWGGFHILELVSSSKYSHKRLGYLVGSLVLPQTPELLLMTTCQLKKNFCSKNLYEICSAVSFAATVCTQEMANCIEDDIGRLLTYSKACVRKRACALGRRLILSNLELGEKLSKMLIERLKDEDTGVLISATAAILDCAIVCPKLFLEAIPPLYRLLDNKNNWLVIKALQALCAMISAEKRLYAKLGEKLLDLLEKTKALSVELEVHKQIVKHFAEVPELVGKTKGKIGNYIENSDPNIRYNGVILLKQLLKVNKDLLIVYKDKLVKLFVSGDNAIKTRSLEIISENCTKDTFQEIADELFPQLNNGSLLLREEIINTLLNIIEANDYQNVGNFEWLFTNFKLMILQCPPACEERLANIIQDIIIRIEEIREDACGLCLELIQKHYNEVLYAASNETKKTANLTYNGYIINTLLYVIGEYATDEQVTKNILMLYEKCMNPENKKLRDEAKIELLLTVMKFFFKFCNEKPKEAIKEMQAKVAQILEWFAAEMTENLEVFELLNFYYGLIKAWDQLDYDAAVKLMNSGFFEELLPVHAQSQSLMKPEEKLAIQDKMKIDQKEFDVLKENQMVKLLIEVEKMSATTKFEKTPTEPETPSPEEKSKKSYKVTKGFALPPGVEPAPATMDLAKEPVPKPKKKVKVKKIKKPETETGSISATNS